MIILYARGYSFDWEKKTITTTGGVYLKTYPSKAEIYINDKLKGKTSKFIRRLIPKVYEIKIIKHDYHPWHKELLVKPGIVSKADNVFLVPFNPKISLVSTESEAWSFFEEQEKTYVLSKNNLYSLEESPSILLASNVINYIPYKNGVLYLEYFTGKIHELDLTSLKAVPFFDQVFPSFNQGEWILSNDNKKLLCKKHRSVEILWLKPDTNNSISRKKGDIEKIDFNEKINHVIWHPKTDEHLIVATNDSILVTELDNRPPRNTINLITTPNPEIQYDAKNKTLYFLSQERLYETEL